MSGDLCIRIYCHRPKGLAVLISRLAQPDCSRLCRHRAGVFAVVAGLVVGSLSALAQGLPTSIPINASTPAPAASMPSALTQSQNPLFGSVASGKATTEVLPLSALDAIDRGLKSTPI